MLPSAATWMSVLTVLVTALASGCTVGGGPSGAPEAMPVRGVEVIIRNETPRLRRVFVQWEGGPRRELGEVPEAATRMFRTPVLGQAMRLEFSRSRRPGEGYAPVERGDRLEWTLAAAGGVFFRRLGPLEPQGE